MAQGPCEDGIEWSLTTQPDYLTAAGKMHSPPQHCCVQNTFRAISVDYDAGICSANSVVSRGVDEHEAHNLFAKLRRSNAQPNYEEIGVPPAAGYRQRVGRAGSLCIYSQNRRAHRCQARPRLSSR